MICILWIEHDKEEVNAHLNTDEILINTLKVQVYNSIELS